MIKIGLIREGKKPIDKRVPLTPKQAVAFQNQFKEIKIVAQSSNIRCFADEDYVKAGIEVVEDISDCDILLGVKEVPLQELIKDKTYFFFSHTTKEQPYNKKLLQTIVEKRIRLIDYEGLTDDKGIRVVAFGRYAGIVGAYNGILTYGKRYSLFNLRPAHKCHDLEDLKTEFSKVKMPPIKIVLTGGGRVANGAMEVLDAMGIEKVSSSAFLSTTYPTAVYTQLNIDDYNCTKDGSDFSNELFYKNPVNFKGDFLRFANVSDILIAGAFWNPKAPVLFTKEEAKNADFKIKVIADITCDIEGSVPSTLRASTIDEPLYDYSPLEEIEKTALSSDKNITVMAVDNLPCELPRNASNDFGEQLLNNVLPHLFNGDKEEVLKRATITENGKLTSVFSYLENYISKT